MPNDECVVCVVREGDDAPNKGFPADVVTEWAPGVVTAHCYDHAPNKPELVEADVVAARSASGSPSYRG